MFLDHMNFDDDQFHNTPIPKDTGRNGGDRRVYDCPIHNSPLTEHEAENGWVYLVCEQGRDEDKNVCFVCTSKDEAVTYLARVRDRMLKYYKTADMRCYCDGSVLLSESKSEQNPGRLYFKCRMKEGKCNFFQWADLAPKGKVKRWLEYGELPRPSREYHYPEQRYQPYSNDRPRYTDRKPHYNPRVVRDGDGGRGCQARREPPRRYEPYRRLQEYPRKSFDRKYIAESY